MKYEVQVIHTGRLTFIVEADNAQQAQERAKASYVSGDEGELTGAEWDRIDSITASPLPTLR